MAESSLIEWTEATWNPVTGCTLVSEGCRHCYAAKLAATRMKHHRSRKGLARRNAAGEYKFTGEVRFNDQWLDQPIRWARPRKIFVCAHGDLFHESVPDEWIDRIFAVMALCPQHVFQVLTKRPERMREYASKCRDSMVEHLVAASGTAGIGNRVFRFPQDYNPWRWPLPNVWLGTSVEDQATADERIPHLLATPAAIRFASYEPALGPVDFTQIDDGAAYRDVPREEWGPLDDEESPPALWWDALTGERTIMHGGAGGDWSRYDAALDWIIAGGESGPHARPAHPDWFRQPRDQCAAAGVAFFFKQWGEWQPGVPGRSEEPGHFAFYWEHNGGRWSYFDRSPRQFLRFGATAGMTRVGKKAAGAQLDGREHKEFPPALAA